MVRQAVLIVLIGSMLLCSRVCSQGRIYYDKFFKTISLQETKYFRDLHQNGSVMTITEVSGDTVVAKGVVQGVSNIELANQFAHYIKSFGNPYQNKVEFASMRGEIDYYRKGVKYCTFVARSGKILFAQLWSPTGEPLLSAGTGSHHYTNATSEYFQFFADSVMVEMFEIRTLQRDTIYDTYDKMAEPRNGYQDFTNDLLKILKYPGFARLMGKQGLVYVEFIVDKKGKLTDFRPLTNEQFNLEKKAVDKLSRMPDWKPAIFRGKPVKMKFTIPIRFRLI